MILVKKMLPQLKNELRSKSNPEKAKLLSRYFKTGPGEYGEGDVFLGVVVPEQRKIAQKFKELSLIELQGLLESKIHEERLTALLILVEQYEKAENKKKEELVHFYLRNTRNVNNWDLVDSSAHKILGDFLLEGDKAILLKLAGSKDLWERRIAVISTFTFINQNKFDYSLKIAEMLLFDTKDLIHKAVGWMLREVGKKDLKAEEEFLQKHYRQMPRTMLRYAIEKFPEEKRELYLKR